MPRRLHAAARPPATTAAGAFLRRFFSTNHPSFTSQFQRQHVPPTNLASTPSLECSTSEFSGQSGLKKDAKSVVYSAAISPAVEVAHPWPEWVSLMELLVKNGYVRAESFKNGVQVEAVYGGGMRFARDRPELIRYLSRQEVHTIVKCGCPTTSTDEVNSAKRLRAHVGIDEGDVCSKCRLRGDCENAYLRALKEEKGRTLDVMRILMRYGLHVFTGTIKNCACLAKDVKQATRRLLHEMVDLAANEPGSICRKTHFLNDQYSAIIRQGDWFCPKCNFLNFAKNMQCLRCNGHFQERCKQMLNEDNAQLPLKRGDWICKTCNFLNFAKNTLCLRCHEKPIGRDLNSWEWECISCNYVNFRRNEYCLKCKLKRSESLNNRCKDEPPPDHQEHQKLSFVEEASPGESSFPGNEESTLGSSEAEELDAFFVDSFPISGGKGILSKDLQAREKWKLEMSQKFKRLWSKESKEHPFQEANVAADGCRNTEDMQSQHRSCQIQMERLPHESNQRHVPS